MLPIVWLVLFTTVYDEDNINHDVVIVLRSKLHIEE